MQFLGTHILQLVIEVQKYVIQKSMRKGSMMEDLHVALCTSSQVSMHGIEVINLLTQWESELNIQFIITFTP